MIEDIIEIIYTNRNFKNQDINNKNVRLGFVTYRI